MRINKAVTVTAGTPVNIWTGTNSADTVPVMARSVFIQMKHAGTGLGYVLAGISRNRTPSTSNSSDLTAELAPATATAPGGSYSDDSELMGIDANSIWVDGSVTGDVIIISFDLKV